MSWELILSVVVACVAVYGAALSTLNFREQRRNRRPAIKVTVAHGYFTYPVGPPLGALLLQLSAANIGERSVMLSSFGFKMPDGRSLAILEPKGVDRFPLELLPRRSCMIAEEVRGIAESLARAGYVGNVELVGFYRDQVGTEYVAEPWQFDVKAGLREAG